MNKMVPNLSKFYENFYLIREVEKKIASEYPKGEIRCPVHLSIGQEVVSAAFSLCQKSTDFAVSTHRAHAHYLSKGGNLNRMIAEIYGKVTGCSKGNGGSMHLVDNEVGFLGSSAIVGNSIPVGVGIAEADNLSKASNVTFIFLGDGAVEEGVFYESVSYAALRKLRVVFICENNLYSVYTNLEPRQPKNRKIFEMVQALGIDSAQVDGNNYEECINVLDSKVLECRDKSEPKFIEFTNYRWLEHCGPFDDDSLGYRPVGELNSWKTKDPMVEIRKRLIKEGIFTIDSLEDFENSIKYRIDLAFESAKTDPYPELNNVLSLAYKD